MEITFLVVMAIVLSAALSVLAYMLHCLTRGGAVASFLVGAFVGVFASINAFFLLTVFTIAGFVATMRDFDRKKAQGLQEGELGERTWKNVLGVGLPPCIAVALECLGLLDQTAFAVMFISTITVAGADTIASEVGIKDRNVYMITTFERVEPGVNGGVSKTGTIVSTFAALMVAILGWFVLTESLSWMLLITFAMGVLGNLLDSVFGAVLENPGYISKYTNNCSTAIIGALVGLLVYMLVA